MSAAYEALKSGMSPKQAKKKFHLKPLQLAGLMSALKRHGGNGAPTPNLNQVSKAPTLMERIQLLELGLKALNGPLSEALQKSITAAELADRIAKEIGLDS